MVLSMFANVENFITRKVKNVNKSETEIILTAYACITFRGTICFPLKTAGLLITF